MTAPVLAIECYEHHAPIGVPCAPGGLSCPDRIARAAALVRSSRVAVAVDEPGGGSPVASLFRSMATEAVEAVARTSAIDPGTAAPLVLREEKN